MDRSDLGGTGGSVVRLSHRAATKDLNQQLCVNDERV
jgi:hypothetical protein